MDFLKNHVAIFIAAIVLAGCQDEPSPNTIPHDNISDVFKLVDEGEVVFVSSLTAPNVGELYWAIDGWSYGWSEDEDLEGTNTRTLGEVCRGSGVGFARCVKKYVDNGGCVKISKDGSEYVAASTTCPRFVGTCRNFSSCTPTIYDLLPRSIRGQFRSSSQTRMKYIKVSLKTHKPIIPSASYLTNDVSTAISLIRSYPRPVKIVDDNYCDSNGNCY